MKKFIFCLCLLFSAAQIFTQNPSLDRLPDDSSKVRAIFAAAQNFQKNDLNLSLDAYRTGLGLARRLGATAWLPAFETGLSCIFSWQAQPDSAFLHAAEAKKMFGQQGNRRGVATLFMATRFARLHRGEYEKAAEEGFEALSIFEKSGDARNTALAQINLGRVLSAQDGRHRECLDIYKKAHDWAKSSGDRYVEAYALIGMGDEFLLLDEHEKSRQTLDEAVALLSKLDDLIYLTIAYNARGNALKFLERHNEAIADYREALRLCLQTHYLRLVPTCFSNIGHVLNRSGRFREALPYHFQHLQMLQKSKKRDFQVENYMLLADAYAGLGQFDSAHFFRKKELLLGDSLLNESSQRQISELHTRYETAQKETKIASQQSEIAQQRTVLWLVGGILALVLLGGFFLFRLNQKLNKRNAEKEFLIKEIHHRVKNNLQVLSSLLHLQSRGIKDEAALDAVREGQNRVDAMGLIHQKLYMGENLAGVEMQDYLQNLGDTLLDSFGLDERVKINYKLQPLHLDVDTAIPLGLIINELLTNSLKYAFPGEASGEVEIKLWEDESKKLCLHVSDNGAGKLAPVDAKNSTGFGSKLIQILSQKLKGKPEVVASEKGYSTLIRFENFKMAN